MTLSERFSAEVQQIHDSALRVWINRVLDAAPAYHMTAPAGVSQRHHPADERCEGGQILHVKRVFRVCMAWAQDYNLSERWHDILLCSALLHDIVKYGPDDKPMDALWPKHDTRARRFLERFQDGIPWIDLFEICEAIKQHMGPWGATKARLGGTVTIGHLLHLADYIASETWFTVEPLGAR